MSEPRYCPISRKWCTCDHRCEDARLRRRLLAIVILILGAIPLVLALTSCATPAELCNMKDVHDVKLAPRSFEIHALVQVVTKEEAAYLCTPALTVHPARYGCSVGGPKHQIIYLTEQPRFASVCSLAELGHEALHGVASHEP